MAHIETSPVVADEIDSFPILLARPDFHDCDGHLAGELESIREQVHEDLFEQRTIGDAIGEGADLKLELAVGLFRPQFSEHLLKEIGHADGLFR